MAERDLDEQFAEIVAHWQDEALGRDPFGDPMGLTDPPDDLPTSDPWADRTDHADRSDYADRTDHADPSGETTAPSTPKGLNPAPLPRPTGPRDTPSAQDRSADAPGGPYRADGTAEDGSDFEVDLHLDLPEDLDDPDNHYSPPPPAPLPSQDDKHFWVMMVSLVVGPLMFLYLLLFNRAGNGWFMILALLISVAGFVLLVLRQPLERDEDDDGIRL